jgi:polysaccharide biosynthesis transport protein
MTPLRMYLDRLRQHVLIVAVVAGAALVVTLVSTFGQGTTYTGRATLSIGSQYRAPEQDAVLAQGYVDYFNESSYQQKLRAAANVPGDVTLQARLAGSSPIIYIEATSAESEVASSAATAMATAFRADVNENREASKKSTIDFTHSEIDLQRDLLRTLPPGSPEAASVTQGIASLQGRISDIQADTSNQLQDLQLSAGVASTAPNLVQNAGLGLVGGLILGCLAALAVGRIRDRIGTRSEVVERMGLEALASVRAGESVAARRSRTQALQRLANLLTRASEAKPMVVAVTAPRATRGVPQIAHAIAASRAAQGDRVLLVQTDLHRLDDSDPALSGVSDLLDGRRSSMDDLTRIDGDANLAVLPAGVALGDPFELFTPARVDALITQARRGVDLVVVETAPILDASETQTICGAADVALLVVQTRTTKALEGRDARSLLAEVGVDPFGVVLVDAGLTLPIALDGTKTGSTSSASGPGPVAPAAFDPETPSPSTSRAESVSPSDVFGPGGPSATGSRRADAVPGDVHEEPAEFEDADMDSETVKVTAVVPRSTPEDDSGPVVSQHDEPTPNETTGVAAGTAGNAARR